VYVLPLNETLNEIGNEGVTGFKFTVESTGSLSQENKNRSMKVPIIDKIFIFFILNLYYKIFFKYSRFVLE
jgi:uncharacterized protein YjaZ